MSKNLSEAIAHRFQNDPKTLLAELSLYEFTKQAWHVLHPSIAFTEGWAVGAVAEHLQAVTEGEITLRS
jgi:hypothetical protein